MRILKGKSYDREGEGGEFEKIIYLESSLNEVLNISLSNFIYASISPVFSLLALPFSVHLLSQLHKHLGNPTHLEVER